MSLRRSPRLAARATAAAIDDISDKAHPGLTITALTAKYNSLLKSDDPAVVEYARTTIMAICAYKRSLTLYSDAFARYNSGDMNGFSNYRLFAASSVVAGDAFASRACRPAATAVSSRADAPSVLRRSQRIAAASQR